LAGFWGAAGLLPLREVFAVEEDDGIGGRVAGIGARSDNGRMGTRGVVDVEWKVWQHRGVGEAEVARLEGRGLGKNGRGRERAESGSDENRIRHGFSIYGGAAGVRCQRGALFGAS
jgi:hypothetical protein